MKKYLITGFSGFVSRHFLDLLEIQKEPANVLGIDLQTPEFPLSIYKNIKCDFIKVDLLNRHDLEKVLCEFNPEYCLHLASFSSVAYSWKDPIGCFSNNTNIFLNLLEALRVSRTKCRILSIGSSEEYGSVDLENLPINENLNIMNPLSPYGAARVSQELLSRVYVKGFGMDIIMTRSFNHIGPGQKEVFVVPSFAKQLVTLSKNGKSHGEILTGDTSIVRDFIDVRDVVKAYYMLFSKGKTGETYNICSGHGKNLTEIISLMAANLKLEISLKEDPALFRPIENRVIIGNNEKIRRDIGWKRTISLEKSLSDILDYWRTIS